MSINTKAIALLCALICTACFSTPCDRACSDVCDNSGSDGPLGLGVFSSSSECSSSCLSEQLGLDSTWCGGDVSAYYACLADLESQECENALDINIDLDVTIRDEMAQPTTDDEAENASTAETQALIGLKGQFRPLGITSDTTCDEHIDDVYSECEAKVVRDLLKDLNWHPYD